MDSNLKRLINILIMDYSEKPLMFHLDVALSDYNKHSYIENDTLAEEIEKYIQQLELDDQFSSEYLDEDYGE